MNKGVSMNVEGQATKQKIDWAGGAIKAVSATSIGSGLIAGLIGLGISAQSGQYLDAAKDIAALTDTQKEILEHEICNGNAASVGIRESDGEAYTTYMGACSIAFAQQVDNNASALTQKGEEIKTQGRVVSGVGLALIAAGIGGFAANRRRKNSGPAAAA